MSADSCHGSQATADSAARAAQADFQQALTLYRLRQWAQTQALCESALKKQPGHFDAAHLLGVIAYQMRDYAKAVALIDKALAILPTSAEAHANRGHALQELGQFDAAIASYDHAIALKPGFADAFHNRGNALQKINRHDAAVASYDSALALNANAPRVHYSRGNTLVKLKRPGDAVLSYDKAIALQPDFAAAYNSRGVALQELKQPDAAIADFDKAIALRPDVVDTYYNRGNALLDLGRLEAALASYDKAIALMPGFTDAHYNRGNALAKLKRQDEAVAAYNKTMTLDPEHIEVRKTLLQHHVAEARDSAVIEQLSRETAALNLKHELAAFHAGKTMSHFRVRHDLEQTDYLLTHGHAGDGLRDANARLRDIHARGQAQTEGDTITLSDDEVRDIARFKQTLLRYEAPAIAACLNPDNDWAAIEDRYFASNPETIYIDNFLSAPALEELRTFSLVSTIWKIEYLNQYLGAFAENGFISPLHLQLARELREKMPRVFGDHALEQLWSFKYDSELGTGINVHADFARVNLNFWITPDEANLDPASGGLVVYDVPAPPSWSFAAYNTDRNGIYAFLEKSGAGKTVVPYKCNRAVLFNSSLFHETDTLRFKDGYENRRINITYLFGVGLP